jgi:hypothetical protein
MSPQLTFTSTSAPVARRIDAIFAIERDMSGSGLMVEQQRFPARRDAELLCRCPPEKCAPDIYLARSKYRLECVTECVTFVDEMEACFSPFFAVSPPRQAVKYLIYYIFFGE